MNAEYPLSVDLFIPEHRLGHLQKRLDKLNRVAKKLGLPEITFERLNTEPQWREMTITSTNQEDREVQVLCHQVRVSGVSPNLSGYQFVARIDHLEGGNLVLGGPNLSKIENNWGTCEPWCDHCQTVRARKTSFIVREVDTGETKQVGKSCLKDFLGHQNPVAVAELASFLWELERGDVQEDMLEVGGLPLEDLGYSPRVVLAASVAVIRRDGRYYPRDTPEAPHGGVPTAIVVREFFADKAGSKPHVNIQAADYDRADLILDWATQLEGSAELYLHNIAVLARSYAVTEKRFGILCSAPVAYERWYEQNRQDQANQSKHIGTQGEKFACLLTHTGSTHYDTQFGRQYVLFFETEEKDNVVWKTGNPPSGIKKGLQYAMQFTVKEHGERNNKKQTIIIRPKFYEFELELSNSNPIEPKKYKKILNEYLKICPDASTLNRNGVYDCPILCRALSFNLIEHAKLLLAAGADPNTGDGSAHPFVYAKTNEAAQLLAGAGADSSLVSPETIEWIEDEVRNFLESQKPATRPSKIRMGM